MLFNSYLFLFLFLPLCLAGFHMLAHRGRREAAQLWLIGFSFWFYAYANPRYLPLLAGSIGVNYLAYRLMARIPRRAGLFAGLGIGADLAVLFYFKYYDFFAENINSLFGSDLTLAKIVLPLGVSFFTFQQIGFLADACRGDIPDCSLREYALFASFFPHLSSGPIVLAGEMLPQYRQIGRDSFSWERLVRGVYLFVLGLSKKVLLADVFGQAVAAGYADVGALSGTDALLTMLFYTLQLYFDFSGYCDMGRGIAHMFGLELPVNFDSPLKSRNIIDFWRSWHITLGRFLRRYVYIPLGGNRRGTGRMYANLLLVFLVSGVWHGAGWTFVLWGLLQGLLYVLTRLWQRNVGTAIAAWPRLRHGLCVLGTFLFTNVAFVFFRSESLSQAGLFLRRLWKGGWTLPSEEIAEGFNLGEFWYVMKVLRLDRLPGSGLYLCAGFLAFALILVFCCRNAGECERRFVPKARSMVLTAVLFVWCLLSLSGVSSFLYYQF
ncbi:MAG: MBOAT family O-acyltransferase [Eubacteriales bacterium]|nr:MBOAT family O-acyltransferase [Eubacteriales bacterium]